ncbi:receptor activity-modifying protein 2-like [Acipenser oxyrinchus oxyrinchus]|uniref:Receptor activity-modifying protein 2-like n=1 Tax=Acipenser oxyrinchus oxyrinchus TaxID=40147 RepID=A0AAD8D0S9_ACIOX|nr:receptor activity-modifying protein 2-like [Acipenser oxyrinchus oxyrinchus]
MTRLMKMLFPLLLWGWGKQTLGNTEDEDEFQNQEMYNIFQCNETLLLDYITYCWVPFHGEIAIQRENWCNWTKVARYYSDMSECVEHLSEFTGCYFPNMIVENFFVQIHSQYFSNCTTEEAVYADPQDELVLVLTITPVCIIPILVSLVVWKSKVKE